MIYNDVIRALTSSLACALMIGFCAIGKAQEKPSESEAHAAAAYMKELEAEQRHLLDEVRRDLASIPSPLPRREDEGEEARARRTAYQRLIRQLEAVEARVNEESTLRTRYASAGSSDKALVEYYDRVLQRVEVEGNQSLPKEGDKSLHGSVVILLTLGRDGSIKNTEAIRSTSARLTSHAFMVLRRLAPFEAFPVELASSAEQIVIGTRFNYTGPED